MPGGPSENKWPIDLHGLLVLLPDGSIHQIGFSFDLLDEPKIASFVFVFAVGQAPEL